MVLYLYAIKSFRVISRSTSFLSSAALIKAFAGFKSHTLNKCLLLSSIFRNRLVFLANNTLLNTDWIKCSLNRKPHPKFLQLGLMHPFFSFSVPSQCDLCFCKLDDNACGILQMVQSNIYLLALEQSDPLFLVRLPKKMRIFFFFFP